jgi:hypothetical protein
LLHTFTASDDSPLSAHLRTLLPEQKLALGVHSWSSHAPCTQTCVDEHLRPAAKYPVPFELQVVARSPSHVG